MAGSHSEVRGQHPQSSDLHLATLLYTPVQAGGSVVRITRAILKNSPTDTPGTATGGGFYTEMIDKVITNVRVTPGEEQLTVTWDPVQGADSYIVRGFYPPYGYVEERVWALQPLSHSQTYGETLNIRFGCLLTRTIGYSLPREKGLRKPRTPA